MDSVLQSAFSPFTDFDTAGGELLRFLQQRLGMGLWMLTRVEGDNWIVLRCEDHSYGVTSGTVLRWSDSFCSRMIEGIGPVIAPRAEDIPAYLQAPIGRQVNIGAYIGMPMLRADGRLFGTLCAIDPQPQGEHLHGERPLLEMCARLLATLLEREIAQQELLRTLERVRSDSFHDSLTGLYNRRAWEEMLFTEDERCHRYGSPATVFIIDVDNLKPLNDSAGHAVGDRLLQDAAQALAGAVRGVDLVARLGGDEFAVLAVDTAQQEAEQLLLRFRERLDDLRVSASIGMAVRDHGADLVRAQEEADQAMYADKRRRKGSVA